MEARAYLPQKTNFELSNDVLFFLSKAILNCSQSSGSLINEDKKKEFVFISDLLSEISESEPGELSDYISTTQSFIKKSDEGSIKEKDICHSIFHLKRGELAMIASYMLAHNVTCMEAANSLKQYFSRF